ncbi:glycosyl transferase family 2 [Pseudoalteromonas sp. S4389]|uniref:glycosyltransferase n=1 Tax=Pseudoalteromonas sp. S4389 TaxID=579556 RepID=UPI0011087901|nr:glycosyltransferase [Pseudoalteromonas sp. S4389]TMO40770.1 glycosyl transferase family 2 [Pseudoalteromonas sp. S4389]
MKFSVLMSVYSGEIPSFLESCLNSLLLQTLPPAEVVLVEDGKIPEELDIVIEKYRAILNIISVRLPANKGLGCALNEGLKSCIYDFVARMDTDDIALPTRFEKQISYLVKNKGVDILGTRAVYIDKDNNVYGNEKILPIKHLDIKESLWACPIIHPSVVFRKSLIEKVGSYSLTLKRRQDYELWFRCAAAGAVFHNLEESLLQYRVLETSHKKNSLKVSIDQAKIGIKGSWSLNLGFVSYVGVCFPIVKSLLPYRFRGGVLNFLARFDPRESKR